MNTSQIKELKKGGCSRILTPKQVGPICWFMATFVAMFYSQRSRKILLDASSNWVIKKGRFPIFWNNREKLFTLLKHILDDKYLKTENRESKDYKNYKKFSDNTFGKILTLLNKLDKKTFPYIPKYITGGFDLEYYIGKLYKLLNVDYIVYEYNITGDVLLYSFLNENFNKVRYRIEKRNIKIKLSADKSFKYIEADIIPPPILMVIVRDDEDNYNTIFYNFLFPNNIINEGDTKDNLKSMKEQIFYKGVEYNLDAVLLTNWNVNKDNGHAIAGITCKKKKYIYNGWTRTSMDPVMAKKYITRKIPCELMKYNWNIKRDRDFCLDTDKCVPEDLQHKLEYSDMCFNFNKGTRILLYVRKDTSKPDTSVDSYSKGSKSPTKSPKSKITGGRVLQKGNIKKIDKAKPMK